VRSATEQLTTLGQLVDSLTLGWWIEQSLEIDINVATCAVERGHVGLACIALRVFVHQVSAQAGRGIPGGDAVLLLDAATRIRAVLGCP
jgi:hypothetical protein